MSVKLICGTMPLWQQHGTGRGLGQPYGVKWAGNIVAAANSLQKNQFDLQVAEY
jgi:hypothetical protein